MNRNDTIQITAAEAKLFGELLWDGLAAVQADQWSDYPWVLDTFCKVAHTYQLEGALESVSDDTAKAKIGAEIIRRVS